MSDNLRAGFPRGTIVNLMAILTSTTTTVSLSWILSVISSLVETSTLLDCTEYHLVIMGDTYSKIESDYGIMNEEVRISRQLTKILD